MSSISHTAARSSTRIILLGLLVSALVAVALVPSLAATSVMDGPSDGEGLLAVRSSPEVATHIVIDGHARNTSMLSGLPLPAGEHEICFTGPADYLEPPCVLAQVVADELIEVVGKFALAGYLEVLVEPADLLPEVTVDGVPRDVAPLVLPLPAGEHEVCFEALPGYADVPCESMTVVEGEMRGLTMAYIPVVPDPEPLADDVPVVVVRDHAVLTGGGPKWAVRVDLKATDSTGSLAEVSLSGTWDPTGARSTCTTSSEGVCSLTLDGLHNRDKQVTLVVDQLDGRAFDGPVFTVQR